MNDINKHFIERSRASLDERAERLEPHLAVRLRTARRQALEVRSQSIYRGWVPAMIGATFAIVMGVGMWFGQVSEQQEVSIAQLDFKGSPADLEMLVVADGLELFEELDFYYWLDQKQQRNS